MRDSAYLSIARSVSSLSTCTRTRVGCILVLDEKIIGHGANGGADCTYDNCVRTQLKSNNAEHTSLCVFKHAEVNALEMAVDARGATLYCTLKPCRACAQALVDAGVVRVVYADEYLDGFNNDIFNAHGMVVDRIDQPIDPQGIVSQLARMDQPEQEYVYEHLKSLLKQAKYNYE